MKEVNIPLNEGSTRYEIHEGYGCIEIHGMSPGDTILNRYTKVVTKVTDDNTSIIVPDPYGSVIARLVAGEFANEYTLPTLQNLLGDAYTALQEMYAYYSNPTGQVTTRISYIPYKHKSIRGN